MFRTLTPANDLEFRYGTNAPTVAPGGTDRCRPLNADRSLRAIAERLVAAVREAGAIALAIFRSHAQELDKGTFAGVARPTSRSTNCCASGLPATIRLRLAVGGERGRSGAARRRRVWIVDPIDGTRAYIAGLPDWAISPRWSRTAGRSRPRCLRRSTDEMFRRGRWARARRCNGDADRVQATARPRRRARRRAAAAISSGSPRRRRASMHDAARSTRSRCASRASPQGRLDTAFAARQQPRLGPCGGRSFGARSRRRADRRLTASPGLQPAQTRSTAR